MPSLFEHNPASHEEQNEAHALPPSCSADEALAEIDRILHQMLLLAELSASESAVDRDSLQKTLERLRNKIDSIADSL